MKSSNVAWNLFGLATPLLLAVAAIPVLLHAIGEEKFGFFMLAWGLVGFSNVLDLGIGRATTYELARLKSGPTTETPTGPHIGPLSLLATAERLSWGFGLAGTLVIIALVQTGLYRLLTYTPALEQDIVRCGWILAFTLPFQVTTALYRGVGEAYGHYCGISIIRVAVGAANLALPAALSFVTHDLVAIVATLLLSRVLSLGAYRMLAFRQISPDRSSVSASVSGPGPNQSAFHWDTARSLFTFGLWHTVSSVLNPLMAQSDRFMIGSLITVAAVSAYAVPYEVTTKVLIIPAAVTTVLFPSLATGLIGDEAKALRMFWRWFLATSAVMAAAALTFYVLAAWLLRLWLGAALPQDAVPVARVIALGLIPYTVGTLMVSLLHAYKRPDITAKAHLMQAPVYIACSYWGIVHYGVIGAAYVWSSRMAVDALMLLAWYAKMRRSSVA